MGEAALLGPPVCQRCGRTCFTGPAEPETGTENCDWCARLLCWACAQMCGVCHETVCSSVLWGSCPCRCGRTESTHCCVAQSDEDKHFITPVPDSSTVTRPWTTSLVPSTHREGPNPRICPGLCQWFGPECTGRCDLEFDHLDTVHICAPCFGIGEGFVDIIDETGCNHRRLGARRGGQPLESDPERQHPQVPRSSDVVFDSLEPSPEDFVTLDDSSAGTSSLPALKSSPNPAGAFLQPLAETADGERGDDDIAVVDDFADAGPPDSPDSGAGDMVIVELAAGAASSSNG